MRKGKKIAVISTIVAAVAGVATTTAVVLRKRHRR